MTIYLILSYQRFFVWIRPLIPWIFAGAKHKKPNINWNEHPSCRDALPSTRAIKQLASGRVQSKKGCHFKASAFSESDTSSNGFRDWRMHLEQNDMGVETLSPRTPAHHDLRILGSYHSHQLPSQGSSQCWSLTSQVSQIGKPEQPERIDSVIHRQKSPAYSAETKMLRNTSCTGTLYGNGYDNSAFDRHHPNVEGLGISTLTHELGDSYASSSVHSSAISMNNGRRLGPLKRDRTNYRSSLSPEVEEKKYKVQHTSDH